MCCVKVARLFYDEDYLKIYRCNFMTLGWMRNDSLGLIQSYSRLDTDVRL